MKTKVKISASETARLRRGIHRFMEEEHNSSIKTPMSPQCRLAVMIPAYHESIGTILRPLLSLARQQDAAPELFEVVVIINNSRREAAARAPAFLANQEALEFIAYLNGAGRPRPEWDKEALAAAAEIKNSGVRIYAIDKSSPDCAEGENNLTHARNRAFLELAWRFLGTPAGWDGIVAMTDADCRLAGAFIKTILDAFSRYPSLNGLAGLIKQELDTQIPHADIISRALSLHLGNPDFFLSTVNNSTGPVGRDFKEVLLKSRYGLRRQILAGGANMAVPVRSWIKVKGIPNRLCGEDYLFGRAVEQLPGEVGIANYSVFHLARMSERCGMDSVGRRTKKIINSVCDFMEGQSGKILIPDNGRLLAFVKSLRQAAAKGELTSRRILELMVIHNCDTDNLEVTVLEPLAAAMTREMARFPQDRDYPALEREFLAHLYDRFPQQDVTHLLVK
jgi:hypothetical protein